MRGVEELFLNVERSWTALRAGFQLADRFKTRFMVTASLCQDASANVTRKQISPIFEHDFRTRFCFEDLAERRTTSLRFNGG